MPPPTPSSHPNLWRPSAYLLRIRHTTCLSCGTVHTSSELCLMHDYIGPDRPRLIPRREAEAAAFPLAHPRLPRGRSEMKRKSATCHLCWTDQEDLRPAPAPRLRLVKPGRPLAKPVPRDAKHTAIPNSIADL